MALNVSETYLDEAAELERLGYSALWLPGGQIDDLGRLAEIVRATTAVPVASAIISPNVYPPDWDSPTPTSPAQRHARRSAGDLGDAETITAQISQHLRAGADHVMLHVLSEGNQPGPIAVARRLAGRLPR